MTINKINFFPSDIHIPHLEITANDIANFLIKFKGQLRYFTELMRLSSPWKKSDYHNQLEKWIASKRGRKKYVAPDTQLLFDCSRKFFETCNNDAEILKMRGLVPEKLVEKIFKERYNGKVCRMGYGKGVEIEGKRIIYSCTNPYEIDGDSNGRRQSVDAGVWDGHLGEFVEVKFNPEAFHTKDINYLKLLILELQNSNCNHIIYLISMGDKNLTMSRLRSLNLWSDSEFKLIGADELFTLKHVV